MHQCKIIHSQINSSFLTCNFYGESLGHYPNGIENEISNSNIASENINGTQNLDQLYASLLNEKMTLKQHCDDLCMFVIKKKNRAYLSPRVILIFCEAL